jgi:hypothetical protein
MPRRGESRKSPPQTQRTAAAGAESSSGAKRNDNTSSVNNERAAATATSSEFGSALDHASPLDLAGSMDTSRPRDRRGHGQQDDNTNAVDDRKRPARNQPPEAAGDDSEILGHEQDGDEMRSRGDIFDQVDIMDIPKYVKAHDTSLTFPEKVRFWNIMHNRI